jgi:hypothetical protein
MNRPLSPILHQALAENVRCLGGLVQTMKPLPETDDRLAVAAALADQATRLRELAALCFRAATLDDLAAGELLESEAEG